MFAFSRPPLPAELAAQLRPVSLATQRRLPLAAPWDELFTRGLRRGSTLVVESAAGQGGLSLALSLLGAASAQGHWTAVVGVDDPGVVAMQDLGLDLRRVLFVPRPHGVWAESTADLLDGVDLVVLRAPGRAPHAAARLLMDRVRERGTVLIVLSEPSRPWPRPADVTIRVRESEWRATSQLESRQLHVAIEGRGEESQIRHRVITLPTREGRAVAS